MRTEHIQHLVRTAETCVAEGSLQKATRYFQRAFELSMPGEFTAELSLMRLSRLYQLQGDIVTALEFIDRAIHLGPREPRYHLIRAELLLHQGNFETALSAIYEAMTEPATHATALAMALEIAYAQNDQQAVNALDALLTKNHNSPPKH